MLHFLIFMHHFPTFPFSFAIQAHRGLYRGTENPERDSGSHSKLHLHSQKQGINTAVCAQT